MATAVAFSAYGDPSVLHPIDIDEPQTGPGQVRVRVRTAGVNPVDCKLRRGDFAGIVSVTFPQRLGNEFAGVVDQVGAGVTELEVGSEVLGFASAEAYAEYVVVPADQVVHRPDALDWDVAGGLSAVGQTAFNGLRELRVGAGDTVLIHAAAGGVGTIAVQLAREWGATVIGTASNGNHDYLRSIGATPVAYGPGLVERVRAAAPHGVTAALDAIGGAAIPASVELVPDRDRIGTTVDQDAATKYGIRRLRGVRSRETLGTLVRLYCDQKLHLPVFATFPLAQAAQAHRVVEAGHVRGKVVLSVS